ncbi:hypothetical protein DL765_010516 [Monosporascus sp. GIB2]|nr:hypothetical protein DL765_010516 [Monosporascus sp. GIB2]
MMGRLYSGRASNLAPLTAGALVSVSVGLEVSTAPSQALRNTYDPFVFAYRLRQILYRGKKVARGLEPVDEGLPGMFDLRVDGAVTGDEDICRVAFDSPDTDDSHSYHVECFG